MSGPPPLPGGTAFGDGLIADSVLFESSGIIIRDATVQEIALSRHSRCAWQAQLCTAYQSGRDGELLHDKLSRCLIRVGGCLIQLRAAD